MKTRLTAFILAAVLGFVYADAFAQGKIYTRKAKLEDFPTRTTKVVSSSSNLLELAFREEVSTRWRISPFEFCSPVEFSELSGDNSLYFLYIGLEDGIKYLVLYKGGKEEETESLKKPFEVVRIPLASEGSPSGRELMMMGAFVDMMQAFVEEAMVSDKAAYSGLSVYNERSLKGKRIYVNPEKADEAYMSGEEGSVAAFYVAPHSPEEGGKCYKMLISTDTHELLYFSEHRFRSVSDAEFNAKDIKKFRKRNGIIVE